MKKILDFLKKSILLENPILLLFAGITPMLATSTGVIEGAFMGISAIVTLVLSFMLLSILKKVIPQKLQSIVHIIAVACVVSIIEILTEVFLPEIRSSLGIYLPILTVSGTVLPYVEKFSAGDAAFGRCTLKGLSYGIGFFSVCLCMSIVRELFGAGKLAGFTIFPEKYAMSLLLTPVGGFLLLGILLAVHRRYFTKETKEEESK